MESVIVASHRRSGTHLMIDTIRNNFPEFSKYRYVNIDRIEDWHDRPPSKEIHQAKISIEQLRRSLRREPRVLKTHFLPQVQIYLQKQKSKEDLDWVNMLFCNCKKIYVYRSGLDVLPSLYTFMKFFNPDVEKKSFADFLEMYHDFDPLGPQLNRVEFWRYHIDAWFEYGKKRNDILFIKFSDLRNDYFKSLQVIADFLESPLPESIVDLRLSNENVSSIGQYIQRIKSRLDIGPIKRTSILMGKGQVGGGKSLFTEELQVKYQDFFAIDNPPRLYEY